MYILIWTNKNEWIETNKWTKTDKLVQPAAPVVG